MRSDLETILGPFGTNFDTFFDDFHLKFNDFSNFACDPIFSSFLMIFGVFSDGVAAPPMSTF